MKIRTLIVLAVAAVASMTLTGCGAVVPPGKTVIVVKPSGETKVVEKGVYKAWGRDRLYFVDNKLQSYKEEMKILCVDDINMSVDVKTLLTFKVDASGIDFIKSRVPSERVERGEVRGQELSLNRFYEMAVKPVVRAAARDVVSAYNTDDIRQNREKITADIDALVRQRMAELKYPLNVSAVLVSNIDYPEVVKNRREEIKNAQLEDELKAAMAEAKIAEAQRQVSIETELAKVRMIRAQAQADENAILTESLTPEFLLWRQYEVLEMTAESLSSGSNNTVFMMPYSAMNPDLMNTALMREAITSKPLP